VVATEDRFKEKKKRRIGVQNQSVMEEERQAEKME